MYSELIKEINSCRNLALQSANLQKYMLVVHSDLPLECSKSEGFWALLS